MLVWDSLKKLSIYSYSWLGSVVVFLVLNPIVKEAHICTNICPPVFIAAGILLTGQLISKSNTLWFFLYSYKQPRYGNVTELERMSSCCWLGPGVVAGIERTGRKELGGRRVAVCLFVGTNKSLRVRLANIDYINVNSWSPCGHSNARLQPLRGNGVLGPGLISWQLPVDG